MSKPNLLVADSDPRSLRILEVALRKAGFAVATATDGGEAARRALRTAPDFILCEVALPAQDGLSVCRALRAEQRLLGMPIVLMGADKTAVAKARAIESGADDYLAKPILLQDLVQRARHLIERRERQRAVQKDAPAALTGEVGDLGLLDVFQSLENWKKSAVIFCQWNGHTARVWARDGQVIDAELGPLSGEPAFWRLMTWESGQFRVEFGPVDRELRIDCGTQSLLMEAMRRLDELSRSVEELPPSITLSVDFAALAARLAELPDEANGVVRTFDGKRTLREAVELSPLDDLNTLAVVQRLLGDGILRRAGDAAAPVKKPSLNEWLGARAPVSKPPPERPFAQSADSPRLAAEPEATAAALVETMAQAEAAEQQQESARAESAAAAVARRPLELVHFPPLRGVRRERLRREAEEARARIAKGEPVRLAHVVELPGWRADGSDALAEPMRRMSPAVGEAAKKFAPDAPVSRIVVGAPESIWDQQTAPAFKLSSAPPPAKPDDAAAELITLPPSKPPPIAPVAANTPPTPVLRRAEPDLEREMRVALAARRPRWPWYGAGAVLGAGALAWLAWPQPATDKKDAPWLEAAAAPREAAPAKSAETAPVVAASTVAPPAPDAYAKALGDGELLLKRGKYKQAIRELKRAAQINPEAVPALLALGDAYLESNEPRSATRPLEKAAALDARSARAQLLLGTAYQSLGRNAEAVKAYQLYLDLEPGGDFASDVRTILANLGR